MASSTFVAKLRLPMRGVVVIRRLTPRAFIQSRSAAVMVCVRIVFPVRSCGA